MLDPTLIGPVPRSTPNEDLPRRRHELPPDLLREASRRLGIFTLVGAALWIANLGFTHLAASHADQAHAMQALDVIAIGAVLISLALYAYTRKRDGDPRRSLDLGLGYMILQALAIGQSFHWSPGPHAPISPVISWIGVLVLLFAALLPTTPLKMLLSGLFAASMNPVGMIIARARGHWDFSPDSKVLSMHFPDYLLVGVAVVISHVITRLGQQVSRARELGSYRLGELLGRGGMGEVYRAQHRMLARPAAIKLIRSELAQAGSDAQSQLTVQRFRREAELVAKLSSPHTVAIYDFGVTQDRTLYLVMELLEGLDLEQLVTLHGCLPPARVIHVLLQVLASLEEAHARGVVHRDIKPANIHVGRVGLEHDFVKVLDFGLAKAIDDARSGKDVIQTAASHIPGTPAYMAPEMALTGDVDGRSDLYAVGCVAYFALCGELVFSAQSPLQVLTKHVSEAPEPPSRRAKQAIPAELEALVLACLAKSPDERPASAASMAEALRLLSCGTWTAADADAWWATRKPLGVCSS